MKIYITGVSGTGKTTITNKLIEKGVKAYGLDETPNMCCWVNKSNGKIVDQEVALDKEFIELHTWICNVSELTKLISETESVVVLGMAENQNEFLHLFDKVILLQCKPETFIKRILERKDNIFGKEKSAQEYLLNTYKEYEIGMLKNGAVSVNTDAPIDTVVAKILSEII
jgi:broad-specificity NMP kinase